MHDVWCDPFNEFACSLTKDLIFKAEVSLFSPLSNLIEFDILDDIFAKYSFGLFLQLPVHFCSVYFVLCTCTASILIM